jgi:peptidyl-prolyl cis-trans isomerase SurA
LVADWIAYRRGLKSSPNLISGKSNNDILDAYLQIVAFDYYKQHLEKYNPVYAEQVAEFRDGNLLFEIMQRQIWNRAGADSPGLRKYYELHKQNYLWKPSAEAILFTAVNLQSAQKLKSDLGNNLNNWRSTVDGFNGQIQADSGRFEYKQLPANSSTVGAGEWTPMQINPDKSVQLARIIRLYLSTSPRSFDDARGLVINDYQNELENMWITELKKKYPVTINESVFKTLPVKGKS